MPILPGGAHLSAGEEGAIPPAEATTPPTVLSSEDDPPPPVPAALLAEAIDAGTAYLIRHLAADGVFAYETHLDPAVTARERYNLLRHAGAMYALLQSYERNGDRETLAAVIRASAYLRSFLAPVPEEPGTLALWSPGDWDRPATPETIKAKLGGAGLALIALTKLRLALPDAMPAEDLEKLGRFIRLLQRPDGSFVSIYRPQTGADGSWDSLYYPGEAMLGLLWLERLAPDPNRTEAVKQGLLHLARSRTDHALMELPPDHWVLIATARYFEAPRPDLSAENRAVLVDHATRLVRRMLAEQVRTSALPAIDGALTPDARTTPTSTRLEGVLAVLPLLRESDPALAGAVETSAARAIRFLLANQIRSGPLAGGLPRHAAATSDESDRTGVIRIDYVQHALSAWIRYEALVTRDGSARSSGTSRSANP